MRNKKLLLTLATALLTSMSGFAQEGETLNVERVVGQGYTPQTETVDFTAAKTFLEVEEVTYDMLRIMNPDGEPISDYAPFDGWFNRDGVAEKWGDNTFTCVKFFQAIPDGAYEICDMNNPAVGDQFTCRWALTANDKTYTYTINVTYVTPPSVELPVTDLAIVTSVEYLSTEASYVEKVASLTDEQVATIINYLGLTSLEDATVFGYNPTTQTLVKAYAGYDGWRNASGDFENWTGNATVPACVKYLGGKTFPCFNINGCEPQTIKTYWAFANDTEAVLVEIDFIYAAPKPVSMSVIDLGITTSVEYSTLEGNYVEKTASLADEQVNEICKELGIESLSEATVYGYNPTTAELIADPSGFDGWRDANGDFKSWTGDANVPACVKYIDGQNYTCYNISFCPSQTIPTFWALANSEKAVLVQIDFNYVNKMTVGETGWATVAFSDPVIIPEGTKAYYISAVEDAVITMTELKQAVPSGEAFVFNAQPGTYIFEPAVTFVPDPIANLLVSSGQGAEVEANKVYVLYGDEEEVGFLLFNGTSIEAGKAYLPISVVPSQARTLTVRFDGEATGITQIHNAQSTMDEMFNLAGQRVKKAQKGLYIVSGKKVIK